MAFGFGGTCSDPQLMWWMVVIEFLSSAFLPSGLVLHPFVAPLGALLACRMVGEIEQARVLRIFASTSFRAFRSLPSSKKRFPLHTTTG